MLVLYMIPVIASGYIGGIGPGLFCSALAGILAAYFLLPPTGSLSIENLDNTLNWATMLLTGTIISILVEFLHRSRKRSEESQERYCIVADNTYDWEWWIDPQGKSVYQSPSCLRITGYDAAVFTADPNQLERIVHPDDLSLFMAHRHGVIRDQLPGNLHFRIIRPDGDVRWIEHFCRPVFGNDGTYHGVRGSNRDITERKQMEEMMVQTEKMMTVGGLAAGMAHEINNPLAGIIQGVQVLRTRLEDGRPINRKAALESGCDFDCIQGYCGRRQVYPLVDSIRESAVRAAKIVKDMLAFSRQGENSCKGDVTAILEKSLSLCATDYDLKKRYDFRHIRILREYQPELSPVFCIEGQLEQVFMNILRNAAQAMSEVQEDGNQPRIVLRTLSENDQVRIEIEDNGPGMDEATRRKVFDPFFTTKRPGLGTGLWSCPR